MDYHLLALFVLHGLVHGVRSQVTSANDMFDYCCECGGGEQVGVGWLRDYGYAFGAQPAQGVAEEAPEFGWRCPIPNPQAERRGTTQYARGHEDGWTRPMGWATCGGDLAGYNEWSLAVPYAGAYLVTVHWQDVGGYQASEVAVENVRLMGDKFAVADSLAGVSESVVVDVVDGSLTVSSHLSGRGKINWLVVERLSDGGTDPNAQAPSGNPDAAWLPSSAEAFYELEFEEKGAPVGLVSVERVVEPVRCEEVSCALVQ